MRARRALASALVLLVGGTGVAAQAEEPGAAPVGRTTGVPAGGPPVLYAPPPDVAVLQNRDPRFRAPYELVSGTERYVDGEYLYTDHLYDDEDFNYPDDFARYGGNAGDLFEFRMSTRDKGLAVRFSLTTLLAADSTIAVAAFDTDLDAETGSSTLPRDPGLPFAGTDAVLTTWGTGSLWSTWTGTSWKSTPLRTSADLEANQITVSVPAELSRFRGKWRTTLATGLYDRSSGGWLSSTEATDAKIINLGFRLGPPVPGSDPMGAQTVPLLTRQPTALSRVLDLDLLNAGGRRDTVPRTGLLHRIFASRLTSAKYVVETSPGTYEAFPATEGRVRGPFGAQTLSRLQPYAVYVPKNYAAARPHPLTFYLHGQEADYFSLSQKVMDQRGEARGSLMLSPSGRGGRGWYKDEAEYDVFEAWNDVARHYRLDPLRTALTGFSMGGYGTYRLGLRYPHLFSRLMAHAPAMQLFSAPNGVNSGVWVPGVNGNDTLVNQWVANARNLPVFHIADAASESTFYPAQLLQSGGPALPGTRSLDSLGYRYRLWSVTEDHALATAADSFPEASTYLGRSTVERRPFHVTLTRTPAADRPDLGLVSDRAYWLSDVAVSGGASTGTIDAKSLGFGLSDPPSVLTRGAGITADGLPYASQERTWQAPVAGTARDVLQIQATNISAVTIDARAARLTCHAKTVVHSDRPLTITFRNCPAR